MNNTPFWYAKSFFHGTLPKSELVSPARSFPFFAPGANERSELALKLRELQKFASAHIRADRIDKKGKIDDEIFLGLRALGAFGWSIPRNHGGQGLSFTSQCRLLEETAWHCPSLSSVLIAHGNMAARALVRFGDKKLQTEYLFELASGTKRAAFALSEHGSGVDASSLKMLATKKRDGYRLHGEKKWVTGGEEADLFVVFARTLPDEDGMKSRPASFIVPRSNEINIKRCRDGIGMRGSGYADVAFDHVNLSPHALLAKTGQGFYVAKEIIAESRIALAASCLGMMKKLVKLVIERATSRQTFGRPIAEFGLIKDKVANMMMDIFATESMIYFTTGLMDSQRCSDTTVETATCKIFASEALWRVTNESMHIAGTLSYDRNEPYERFLRDARAYFLVGGTNEILRLFIANEGASHVFKTVKEDPAPLTSAFGNLGPLSDLASQGATKARKFLRKRTKEKDDNGLHAESLKLAEYTQWFGKMMQKMAPEGEQSISEKQFVQKRIADTAMLLFALSTCLARTEGAIIQHGQEGALRELNLCVLFCRHAESKFLTLSTSYDHNEDELRKAVASKSYVDGCYPLDMVE